MKNIHHSVYLLVFLQVYIFIYEVILGSIGNNGIIFYPFLFFFWLFIFFFNLIGLFPFAFTIGSHFTITICFSLIAWMGAVILLVESEGMAYFGHFFLDTINFYLATFISFIEVLSFTFRAVSLALRLFANLVAGHVLLHLCGALIISLLYWHVPFNVLYLVEVSVLLSGFLFLFCFELIVSFVQSYIFLLLTCIYLQDTLNNYSKNLFYYSTKYLKSVAYKMYTIDYNNEYSSKLFNDFFVPKIMKYRFITSLSKQETAKADIYTYFKQDLKVA
jgi:F-type H+-transporting ATPase subunit a